MKKYSKSQPEVPRTAKKCSSWRAHESSDCCALLDSTALLHVSSKASRTPSPPITPITPLPSNFPLSSSAQPPTPPGASLKKVVFQNFSANSVASHDGWSRLRDSETGAPAPCMAPSRADDGSHGAGDGPPPQCTARGACGGGAERGGGSSHERRPTGTERAFTGERDRHLSLSLQGGRGVTAPCGTPQGLVLHWLCQCLQQRQLTRLTAPRSRSSCSLPSSTSWRWRRGEREEGEGGERQRLHPVDDTQARDQSQRLSSSKTEGEKKAAQSSCLLTFFLHWRFT